MPVQTRSQIAQIAQATKAKGIKKTKAAPKPKATSAPKPKATSAPKPKTTQNLPVFGSFGLVGATSAWKDRIHEIKNVNRDDEDRPRCGHQVTIELYVLDLDGVRFEIQFKNFFFYDWSNGFVPNRPIICNVFRNGVKYTLDNDNRQEFEEAVEEIIVFQERTIKY